MTDIPTSTLAREQPVQHSPSPTIGDDQSQCEPNFQNYERTFRLFETANPNAPNATDDFYHDTLEIKESPLKEHTLTPSIPKDLLDAVKASPNATNDTSVSYRAASLLTAPYRVVCNRKEGNFWASKNTLSPLVYDIDNDVKYSQPQFFDVDKELLSAKAKSPAQVK